MHCIIQCCIFPSAVMSAKFNSLVRQAWKDGGLITSFLMTYRISIHASHFGMVEANEIFDVNFETKSPKTL